jgi:uncharacterized membrane protein (DUF4010 family)
MLQSIENIPVSFINFILITLFSLLLGLEQRRRHIQMEAEVLFGTDRSFTFIGILGYILWIVEADNHYFYLAGLIIISALLGIYYFQKMKIQNKFGLTAIIIAIITYCLAPLVFTQPRWLVLIIVVIVLFLAELKDTFLEVSRKFDNNEFLTLGKFIIIAGIILPIVPNEQVFTFIQITPYQVWLAVVIISAMSYFSYLLNKFVFTDSGIMITGILGGLYSSTATSIILARKSNEKVSTPHEYASAIILATSMMYIRIFVLMVIFNRIIAMIILPYFAALFLINLGTGFFIYNRRKQDAPPALNIIKNDRNPLEFKVALIFAVLYVAFTLITHYTVQEFGTGGLNILSYIAGLTDIDPFLMNLLQGKYAVADALIAFAAIQATVGNNILKGVYSYTLSDKSIRKLLLSGWSILFIAGMAVIILIRILN